uniref:YicC family protein n=1 Tax=Prevotella heparinolytica TaxID=28113 RepID=UPI0035A0D0BB
ETQEFSKEEWALVHSAVEEAVNSLVDFRKQEGVALEKKFREKIANIACLLEAVVPFEKERVSKVKERITDALEKTLNVDYDKNRLEQELIYYIEKLDINEEKQRLGNHLKYFINTLESGSGQGKKLGFIAQEMGREINTLGSKSNHVEMQKLVVQMKDELEQIKEQVLNVM